LQYGEYRSQINICQVVANKLHLCNNKNMNKHDSQGSIADILKQAGFKVTSPRISILKSFSGDCTPMSAEVIHKKLKNSKIDLVTVYRTLASFEKGGIVKRVDLHKDSAYYELASHHHHHIICKECGLVEGFDQCNVQQLSKSALQSSSKFKTIESHSLEFFGICKNCMKV
jgi:Fur family ferric uptake transcriptional regulator